MLLAYNKQFLVLFYGLLFFAIAKSGYAIPCDNPPTAFVGGVGGFCVCSSKTEIDVVRDRISGTLIRASNAIACESVADTTCSKSSFTKAEGTHYFKNTTEPSDYWSCDWSLKSGYSNPKNYTPSNAQLKPEEIETASFTLRLPSGWKARDLSESIEIIGPNEEYGELHIIKVENNTDEKIDNASYLIQRAKIWMAVDALDPRYLAIDENITSDKFWFRKAVDLSTHMRKNSYAVMGDSAAILVKLEGKSADNLDKLELFLKVGVNWK